LFIATDSTELNWSDPVFKQGTNGRVPRLGNSHAKHYKHYSGNVARCI